MRIRTIGGESGDPPAVDFSGIRDIDKHRAFLMADLLTYQTYRIVSRYANSKSRKTRGTGSKEEEDRELAEEAEANRNSIRYAVRSMMVRFSGYASGTPNMQLNKRTDNMIALMEGKPQPNRGKEELLIPETNLSVYRNCFRPEEGGTDISVKTELGQDFVDKVEKYSGRPGNHTHLPLGDIYRIITEKYFPKITEEPLMQSVMKIQYDLQTSLFRDRNLVSDELGRELVRMYLALSCILNVKFTSVGDVLEPVFSHRSLEELLIHPQIPENTGRLLIISGQVLPEVPYEVSSRFDDVRVIDGCDSALGLEIAVYKARLAMNFRKCNAVVIGSGPGDGLASTVSEILNKISWKPAHAVSFNCMPEPSFDDSFTESPERILPQLPVYYDTGICSGDPEISAMLHYVYRDILKTAYPDIDSLFEADGSMDMVSAICGYAKGREMARECEHPELVEALVRMLDRTSS